jgi:hypothetical protein
MRNGETEGAPREDGPSLKKAKMHTVVNPGPYLNLKKWFVFYISTVIPGYFLCASLFMRLSFYAPLRFSILGDFRWFGEFFLNLVKFISFFFLSEGDTLCTQMYKNYDIKNVSWILTCCWLSVRAACGRLPAACMLLALDTLLNISYQLTLDTLLNIIYGTSSTGTC